LTIPITVTGLTADPAITLNLKGQVRANVELSTVDGNCVLQIPSATYLTDRYGEVLTTITATRNNSPPAPPANNMIVFAYDLGPTGASFFPYITLVFKYDPAMIPGVKPADLQIGRWNGVNWEIIKDVVIDTEAHTVSVQIWHFSNYALISPPYVPPTTTPPASTTTTTTPTITLTPTPKPTGTPLPLPTVVPPGQLTTPLPAGFMVGDLQVSPAQVKTGETVTVSVILTNTGGTEGTCRVTLKVNGLVADFKVISLGGGESTTVTFTTSGSRAGNFDVDVDGLLGSFSIAGMVLLWPVVIGGIAVIIIVTSILGWRSRR
jgi:hypothetical protein